MSFVAGIVLRFVAYVGAHVVLTWPLAAEITTHLPRTAGNFVSDLYYAGWVLAWQTHALTTDPLRFADANIYGGAPLALFYGTPGFGVLPVFAPIFLTTGNPTLALNGVLVLNLALTATSLHMVARAWTGSELAAIVAGATLLTSQVALMLCGMMPQYAALWAMPVIIWLLARPELGWRAAAGLGALVAMQSLTDVVYVAIPLVLTIAALAVWMLLRKTTRGKGLRIVVALVAAGVVLAPVYAGFIAVRLANPDLRTQSVWSGNFPIFVDLSTGLPMGWGPLSLDAVALLPAILGFGAGFVGLVDVSPVRRRLWRHAAFWFFTVWLFVWVIPLQYPSYRGLVLQTVAREFARLGFAGLIAFCLLTALGFAACVEAVRRHVRPALGRVIAGVLAVVVVAVRIGNAPWLPGDYPILEAPDPEPEGAILRAGSGPVLVLPVGDPRVDTYSHSSAMYRSIAHWRPLLNGYCSYQPAGFRDRMDLVRRLPDSRVLDALRRDTRLTSIVVHASGMAALTTEPWRKAIASGALPGVRIDYSDDDVLVLGIDSMGWW